MPNSARVIELRDLAKRMRASYSDESNEKESLGSDSLKRNEAQSCSNLGEENARATSFQSSESAGKRKERASSSRREMVVLSSMSAWLTAWRVLDAKGMGVCSLVRNIVNDPLLGVSLVLVHSFALKIDIRQD